MPDVQLLYIGTQKGLESRIVPEHGIAFESIEVRGVVRKSLPQMALGIMTFLYGSGQALSKVRRYRPDVVIGTGGYVSAPVIAAAALLRRPILIQEQNVIPGVANRFLARFASCVAVAYPQSKPYFPSSSRVLWTGNPLRPEFLRWSYADARERLGLEDRPLVLVYAGSRGSAVINRLMSDVIAQMASIREYDLWYVTGEAHYPELLRRLEEKGIDPGELEHVTIKPYLHEMPVVLAACDLVVMRAGAMAISELTAVGKPAILIPSPHVTHHHQEKNAAVLEEAGAALVLAEERLQAEHLMANIQNVIRDPLLRNKMAKASRSLGRPDALKDIIEQVIELGASN